LHNDTTPRGDDDSGKTVSTSQTSRSAAAEAMVNSYAGRQMPCLHLKTFHEIGDAFATRTIRAGAKVRPLNYSTWPLPDFPIPSGGAVYDIYDYVARNRIAGLMVMKDDEVLLEH